MAEKEYEVEAVVGERIKDGKKQYLIRWKGYADESNTWEDLDNLNCDELIQYFKEHGVRPRIDVKRIVGAEKKNGQIFYTFVDKKGELTTVWSHELRPQFSQRILDFYEAELHKKSGK